MRNRLLTATMLAAGLIAGCASPEPIGEKATAAARASLPETPRTWAMIGAKVGEVPVGWVDAFNDSLLSKLVAEAQHNNRNLQAAAAAVDGARALTRQAGAALLPQVNLSGGPQGSGSLNGAGGATTTQNISLQASWEPDLWGRVRAGQQAAQFSAQSAEADYRFAQHSLAAGVARAYFVAIEARQQVAIAQSRLDALAETGRIVDLQYENGLVSAQDRALTRSDMASARDSLASAEGGTRDALRALEQLLGRYPAAELDVGDTLPAPPKAPPPGLPSEILERRPDLVAAERRIASAMGSTAQAKAAKLPQINLTTSIGGSAPALSDLLNPANLLWTAAANILVPVIDGGARQAQVEAATAEQKQAIAAYADAALTAFAEVEGALDQQVVLERRRVALTEAYQQAQEALRIGQLRYKEGESSLLDVLTIQQQVFGARSNLLSVERSQLQQFIDLNLALGGDWRSGE